MNGDLPPAGKDRASLLSPTPHLKGGLCVKKFRLLGLALAAALALSGCTSMLERSYTSSAAHVDYSVTEDSSILRAESYQALVNSILYFVGEHAGGGTIRLYNYTGNVEADLAQACSEVMEDDPLGAYAVASLDYESARILTYYEVTIRITYRRTLSDVSAIRPVSGQSGIRQELAQMVDSHLSRTTLRTSYFSGDAQTVSSLFWLSFYSDPALVLETPALAVSFYPEEGSQRILEVTVDWPVAPAELEQYALALSEAAGLLTENTPPAGEAYTTEELAALLHAFVNYDPTGSYTALAALTGEPVNDLGVLLALEYLCGQYGVEASVVYDTAGAQMWLIVSTPSGYRHLLPRDLRPGPESDGNWVLPLYTDEELAALGFEWPRDLHPACVDYSGDLPE